MSLLCSEEALQQWVLCSENVKIKSVEISACVGVCELVWSTGNWDFISHIWANYCLNFQLPLTTTPWREKDKTEKKAYESWMGGSGKCPWRKNKRQLVEWCGGRGSGANPVLIKGCSTVCSVWFCVCYKSPKNGCNGINSRAISVPLGVQFCCLYACTA